MTQFLEIATDDGLDNRLNLNLTANAVGVPSTTSGNAKKAPLVDHILGRIVSTFY